MYVTICKNVTFLHQCFSFGFLPAVSDVSFCVVFEPVLLRETFCITGLFLRTHIQYFCLYSEYNSSAVTLKC